MKDTKTIISALKKEDGVVVTANVGIKYGRCGDITDKGFGRLSCTLARDVRASVQITTRMIDEADEKATELEEAAAELETVAAADDATDEQKEAAAKAKADAKAARDAVEAMEVDNWIRGENNHTWITTYQLLAMLRDNPETVFLATYLDKHLHSEDEDVRAIAGEDMEGLLTGATVTHIAIDVTEGEEYISPFRTTGSDEPIENDSVYHEFAQLKLSDIGWDKAEEIREDIRAERRERLRGGNKRSRATRRRSEIDDSED